MHTKLWFSNILPEDRFCWSTSHLILSPSTAIVNPRYHFSVCCLPRDVQPTTKQQSPRPMPQKLQSVNGKVNERPKALAMRWLSSKALKCPDEPSSYRQAKTFLSFFTFPPQSLWIWLIKIHPNSKCSQSLNKWARDTLQDTADLWNVWLMKYKLNTVHSTQNRLVFHCVLYRCWKYIISFMGQFRAQDYGLKT